MLGEVFADPLEELLEEPPSGPELDEVLESDPDDEDEEPEPDDESELDDESLFPVVEDSDVEELLDVLDLPRLSVL